jgi:type VII secretion protein EccB
MRRLSLTTISGVMIAIVVAAGAYVVGLLKPGSTNAWKYPGTIIVERETGARYILDSNGDLVPTLNYPSAVLALPEGQPKTALVSRSKLSKVPHGEAIGIADLPDSLPSKANLITNGWTVCSQQQPADKGRSQVKVSLFVSGTTGNTVIDPDAAVFVRTVTTRKEYLLWHGRRYELPSNEVLANLGISGKTPVPVAGAFLNALAPGPSLAAPHLDGVGDPGPSIGGVPTRIGQVLASDTKQHYLVLSAKSIAPLTSFAASLAATAARNGGGPDRHQVSDADAAPFLDQSYLPPRDLPSEMPSLNSIAAQAAGVCVDFGNDANQPVLSVPDTPSDGLASGSDLFETDVSLQGSADNVVLPLGKAAVIRQKNSSATDFLVAGTGKKYAISPDLLPRFGYTAQAAFTLPENLVLLVPTGPAMDPAAAKLPAT